MKQFTKTELRLLIALFAAYTAAYISRCNLSPALDSIAKDFGLSTAAVGLLPTCFAIPYAVGQVFAGLLADRLPASRLMGIGLFGSAFVNILFSFSPAFPLLLVLWTLNGLLQSMIWTPVVRTMATRFRKDVRDRAVFFISLSIIFGYLIAWALAGFLTSLFSWRTGSLTCGLATAAITIPALLSLRNGEQPAAGKQKDGSEWPAKPAPIPFLLLHTNLLFLLICCFGCGYVRDGITNWTAKLLMDTQGIDLSSAVGILLILPVINFLGILLGRFVYKRCAGKVFLSACIMLACSTLLCALLIPVSGKSAAFCIVLLVLISALATGLNPMLSSLMPMTFRSLGRVAFVAGIMDAMIYLGSAFSGFFAGYLADTSGWTAVFVSWAVLSLIDMLLMLAAGGRAKRGLAHEDL